MKAERKNLLQRFLVWREKNIKEKRFILILSFLVGIFTADTESAYPLDKEFPNGELRHDGGQLPLSGIPRGRHLSGWTVRALCGKG